MTCDTCGRAIDDPATIFCSNPVHLDAQADRAASALAKRMIADINRACDIGHNVLMEVAQSAETQPNVTIAQPFGIRESADSPLSPPAPRTTAEPTASSACPICGVDTPHYHPAGTSIADGPLYLERVIRPQFERVVSGLFKTRRARRGFTDPSGPFPPFYERDGVWQQRSGDEYVIPEIQEFWQLWLWAREHALEIAKRDAQQHLPLQPAAASLSGTPAPITSETSCPSSTTATTTGSSPSGASSATDMLADARSAGATGCCNTGMATSPARSATGTSQPTPTRSESRAPEIRTPAPTDRVQEIEGDCESDLSEPFTYEQAAAMGRAIQDLPATLARLSSLETENVALLARVRSLEADADRWLAVTRAVELFSAPIELIDADDMSYLIVAGDERLGAGASLAAAADCIVDDLRKSEALFARAAHPLEAPANGQ